MTKVSKSVFIPGTPEEVFTYLADFTNTAEWDPGVAEATKTSEGPVGFGSTFDLVTLFRGRRVPVSYEVTVYEPPSRVVLVGSNKNFTGTDDIGITPEGDGTRVSWNANFQIKGAVRLFLPFLGGVFEKLSVEAMEGLESTFGVADGRAGGPRRPPIQR
jgi:carbon monoxide dehydrogenase subunit G